MSKPHHRYVVVCEDGSREEVLATGLDWTFEPGIGPVLKMKPHASYSGGPQGRFVRPQGVHRTEKFVELPEGEAKPEEESD